MGGTRLDVFWKDGFTGEITHAIRPSEDADWDVEVESVGHDATHSPTCVSTKTGMDLFWRGADGQLVRRSFASSSWLEPIDVTAEQGWEPTLESSPEATSWDGERIDLFWQAKGGGLVHAQLPGEGEASTELLAADIASDPSAVSWGSPRLDVLYTTRPGALGHSYHDASGPWTHSTVAAAKDVASKPAVTSIVDGRLDVFWRGSNDRLQHQSFTDADVWSEVEDLGGDLMSGPDAIATSFNTVHLVARRGQTIQHAIWVRKR